MGTGKHWATPNRGAIAAVLIVGLLLTVAISCRSSQETARRTEPNLDPGWPRANNFFTQVSYQQVKGEVPIVPGAEYVNDDEICATCHGAYAKSFAENVHRGDTCESCHGPASKHVEARGKEPGLIFSFKSSNPLARAEACLRCHEENTCAEGTHWRRSKHANCNVTCTDCHRGHYNVRRGTPRHDGAGRRGLAAGGKGAGFATAFQTPAEGNNSGGQGYVHPTKNLPSLRGTSNHLGAVATGICYRCHGDMQEYQKIAGPHQICGPNGFNCTTCHDPHGQILERSRGELCLQCHTGAPTMAWHSAIHAHNGVQCTDCHNPHPQTSVPQVVGIYHGNGPNIVRPKRLMMAVRPARDLLQVPPEDLRPQCASFASPDQGRQDGLLRLPRSARSGNGQPQGGDHQPGVLQVPRGEAGPVRLRAPAGAARTATFAIIRTAPWPTTC